MPTIDSPQRKRCNVLIVGGGFFGMYVAQYFAANGKKVHLIETEKDFMTRASWANQARIHNGYHYPRSVLTAMRSHRSFPNFIDQFEDCVVNDFDKYYMVGKILSKVSATQFKQFVHRIGAPIDSAPREIKKLVNRNLIEDVFKVKEVAFDADKLRVTMVERLQDLQVECHTETRALSVSSEAGLLLTNAIAKGKQAIEWQSDQVFNCTYSMLNELNNESGLKIIPLKHEMTEMALVEVPHEIRKIGITVMCGPFFSCMPFPPKKLHTFSHVRYTPHMDWNDSGEKQYLSPHLIGNDYDKTSWWSHMKKDAIRYLPILDQCEYQDSIWEVKTVLPSSEIDDSRPILFKPNYMLKGYHCIMGGKIDNVYDVISAIQSENLL
jgi:glycine/D-amino acid oxidase-like deaminating enzyme